MEKIARKLTDLVGNTPLLELSNYNKSKNLKARLVVKLEYFNPAGSVKDRIALAMIEDAEVKGVLQAGATIIEPTSGNTGVGLAFVAAAKGYKLILTMPDTMSVERRNLLKALGAELVLKRQLRTLLSYNNLKILLTPPCIYVLPAWKYGEIPRGKSISLWPAWVLAGQLAE